jgi:carbonic anhydrase
MLHKQKEINLGDVIEENVLVQADNLKTHPAVSAALREQRIRIYGWVYQFEMGTISIFDPVNQKYIASAEVKDETSKDPSRFAL